MILLRDIMITGILFLSEVSAVCAAYCSYELTSGLTGYTYCSYRCCGTYYYRYCCAYYYTYYGLYNTVNAGVIAGAVIGALFGLIIIIAIVIAIIKSCNKSGTPGVTVQPRQDIAMVTTRYGNSGAVMTSGLNSAPSKADYSGYPDQPYPPPTNYDAPYPPQQSFGYPPTNSASPGQVTLYPPAGPQPTPNTLPPPYVS